MLGRKKAYPWEKHYPEGVSWDADIKARPVATLMDDAAENFAEVTAIDFFGKTYTYEEIGKQVNAAAKGLQNIGVNKGTRVALLLPNCPQFVISYFAILKIGGVVVNCNPLYTINELKAQINDADPKVLITLNLAKLYEKADKLLQSTMIEKLVVSEFTSCLPTFKRWMFNVFKINELAMVSYGMVKVSFEQLLATTSMPRVPEIDPKEDLAVLQYTGGTTGVPKGAMLTHQNVYANAVQCGMWFTGLEDGKETMMGVLPLFHVFAMTVIMNLSEHKGCKMILHPRLDIKKLIADIVKKKPTLMPGVPTLFSAICQYPRISSYNLSSIKMCISGGAPLPSDIRSSFEELTGCSLIEGYGLTESSPVASANPLFGDVKEGSIGLPLPQTVIEIRNTEGRRGQVSKGDVGEICIKGPQVMKGYYNSPEHTKKVLQSGRLHTGDMGYMDEDGYVFVVDRLKELIITSGFNVYPSEIEEEIYKHPAVKEAAVKGIDDDHKGQVVKAFVALNTGQTLNEKELIDFLRSKMAKYKLPSQVEFRDELPKTLIGKISKKDL